MTGKGCRSGFLPDIIMRRRSRGSRFWTRTANEIIGAAIKVHRHLGPTLDKQVSRARVACPTACGLESAYERCLCRELVIRNLDFEQQKPLPVVYKGIALDCGYS